jgi:hypothetical protein
MGNLESICTLRDRHRVPGCRNRKSKPPVIYKKSKQIVAYKKPHNISVKKKFPQKIIKKTIKENTEEDIISKKSKCIFREISGDKNEYIYRFND